MRRFRRTGSPTRFFVDGGAADAADAELLKALQKERFKPLEASETEIESIGWVSPADASGARFEPEELLHGPFLAFALRIDRKRVSPTLLKLQIAADLRGAARGGKPLPREEKRQIVLEAKRKLFARALPTVSLVDCLWNCGAGVLHVFATGGLTLEIVSRHFRETFDRGLTRATPTAVARRLGLSKELLNALASASPADFAPKRDAAPVGALGA
jgi:hypothetical protein